MNIALFAIFLIILLYDVRKGIIIYAPFKLFFISGYILFGKLNFDIVFSFVALVAYIANYGIDKRLKAPWYIGLIVALFAHIANSLYPLYNPLIAIRETFSVYLYAFIYFASINTKENRQLAINSIIVLFILLIGNGLVEFATRMNILGDFQKPFIKEGIYISEQDQIRFGIHRTRSFVPHSIGFGVECACFFYFFLLCYKTKIEGSAKYLALLLLSAIGVIISGSRSPLVGLAVMLLPLFVSRTFFNLRNTTAIIAVFTALIFFSGSYVFEMIMSLDTGNYYNGAGGSSIDMRLVQLDYSIYYWLQKPIWGWGASAQVMDFGRIQDIHGAESVWFTMMMRRGIIGMLAYIQLYVAIVWSVWKSNNRRFIIAFMLSWLIIDSITNLPGINMFFPLMIITILYKMPDINELLVPIFSSNKDLLKKLKLKSLKNV